MTWIELLERFGDTEALAYNAREEHGYDEELLARCESERVAAKSAVIENVNKKIALLLEGVELADQVEIIGAPEYPTDRVRAWADRVKKLIEMGSV